jgi:dipeptidyl aminopeptidase/acylaminoacyl peptidase
MIEGILHYPPGKFEHKNLPLFVYLHGGPTDASLNRLQTGFYTWAPLAASEGWLVLECNYRGSTGYGDQFLNEISGALLSRPGRDILAGVDSLVKDGIADPTRLNIGGYSFGGFLTNWLITQTTRFNAALSGAGASELVSMWGTTDFPPFLIPLMCGFPWEASEIYEKESIMNKLNKAETPTLITTGANDIRVPADQSYMLERSLTYLGVPVKLLLFPDEDHSLSNNPWHEKIKAREELKWLAKYDHLPELKTVDLL